jgi:O-antigen/teichoic acid export membrane protein
MNESSSHVARSAVVLFVTTVGSATVTYFGLAIFARKLGAAALGVFFLLQALSGVLRDVAGFGIGPAIIKRLSEGQREGDVIATAMSIQTFILIFLLFSIFIFKNSINDYLGADIWIFLAAYIFFQQYSILLTSIMKGQLRIGETGFLKLARDSIFVGTGLLLIIQGYGLYGVVYGLLAGEISRLIAALYITSISLSMPTVSTAQSLLDFSKHSYISSVSKNIFSYVDVLLVGYFLTTADVGIYEIPWRVATFVLMFSNALNTSLFPKISEWDVEEFQQNIESIVAGSVCVVWYIAVPALFGAIVLGREILRFGFGSEYEAGWVVLIIVMIIQIVKVTDGILAQSLQALDHPYLNARVDVIALLIGIGLNAIFIWNYEMVGAAVAMLLAIGFKLSLHYQYLERFIHVQFRIRDAGSVIAASVTMALLLLLARQIVSIHSIFDLLGFVIGGVVVYGIITLSFPNLRKLLFDNVNRVLGR